MPPILSSKFENLVGLEEEIEVTEPTLKIDLDNDLSEACSND